MGNTGRVLGNFLVTLSPSGQTSHSWSQVHLSLLELVRSDEVWWFPLMVAGCAEVKWCDGDTRRNEVEWGVAERAEV